MRNDMRVVTLEEHFATSDYRRGEGGAFKPEFAKYVGARIADVEEHRLPEMDAAGIDIQVLSLTSPGVQSETDADTARKRARVSNAAIGAVVKRHPERFRAFAALPTQSGKYAADELRRAVEEEGFVGAMVNGQAAGKYLDHEDLDPLWATAEELGVPIYLHPAFPAVPVPILEGFPELTGPVWGWGFETASHALRIILSGVFDRHPGATLILGHMGEGLPFTLSRLDDRYAILDTPRQLSKPLSHYILHNLYVTTAGVESAEPLHAAIAALGSDRVLFSVDYPYQIVGDATDFIVNVPLEDSVRRAVIGETAAQLLRIGN